ncbi:MAG TPA: biotin/lipoyl-binding protein, partial [Micavibrio sp.]|nr:biotin/lipoyl-binding protein [Micavibrio sp.]
MSRSTKNKFLAGVAALTLLAGGMALVQFTQMSEAAAQAGGEMPAMPVPYVLIEEKPVQIWKEFSGRLTAVDYVEIRPQVSGLIQKVHFQDGQIVKKGDILYSIDPRPYEAAAAQARAELASANE